MASKLSGIELTRYDDLFKTDAEREADRQERIQIVPAAEVFPYSRQPYLWDCDYCSLQSDINNAEVNRIISPEQAWYLREKYLRMEREVIE